MVDDLGFRLARVARQLRTQWGERLGTLALNQPQAAILRTLAGTPGLGLRELSRMIGADPSNLRREIERLAKRDLLVVDTPQHVGVKATLSLTTAGKRLANETEQLARTQMASTIDQLSLADQAALTRVIAQLEVLTGIAEPTPEDEKGSRSTSGVGAG
ncbi:MarR family winged helix-turn-helix transcriptional regulator [Ferrimicrobium sp.]|uniref:MarR family winged helix-turn-helix transcriptional regulator n=1 Tax=Ferrimicrobium sp. TaxID=2926050 RepID=UPI0026338E6B|nr:MarR family winged helix-turn-helix transcriptional regulator [Ferrimicrobium sp.]